MYHATNALRCFKAGKDIFQNPPLRRFKSAGRFNFGPFQGRHLHAVSVRSYGSSIAGATAGAYIVTPTGYTVDATYGTPVNLPIPVNYPQTACMNLMPLSAANNWAPEASDPLIIRGHRSEGLDMTLTPRESLVKYLQLLKL